MATTKKTKTVDWNKEVGKATGKYVRAIDKLFINKGEVDKTLGHIASTARDKGIVVVEWSDKFPDSLPESYVRVQFERLQAGKEFRRITFSGVGEEQEEFLKELEDFVHTGN